MIVFLLFILIPVLYIVKKDSADGRFLIWRCSVEMIKDNLFFGSGSGGFKAKYMNYQARYFANCADDEYAMIADNVNFPFNEYLDVLIKYGLIGFVFFVIVLFVLNLIYVKYKHINVFFDISYLSLIALLVLSVFSYPLKYPYIILISIFCVFTILYFGKIKFNSVVLSLILLKIIIVFLSMFYLLDNYNRMKSELLWNKLVKCKGSVEMEKILNDYAEIYNTLEDDECFLYNYAYALKKENKCHDALLIAQRCESMLANYDLQLLLGELCLNQMDYDKAMSHYKQASYMCPNRFIPLYKIFEIMMMEDRVSDAISLGNNILSKKVKIESHTIKLIKAKVKLKIKAYEVN